HLPAMHLECKHTRSERELATPRPLRLRPRSEPRRAGFVRLLVGRGEQARQRRVLREGEHAAVDQERLRLVERLELPIRGEPTIGLSAGDGWNLSSLTTAAHSVNIADRDYFQAAMAGKDGVGSVLVTRGTLNAKTIVLAVPVAFDNGTKGVLSGALALANIEKQLNDVVPGSAIELRVIDRLGHQFIGPGSAGDTLPDQNALPEVRQRLAGASSPITSS